MGHGSSHCLLQPVKPAEFHEARGNDEQHEDAAGPILHGDQPIGAEEPGPDCYHAGDMDARPGGLGPGCGDRGKVHDGLGVPVQYVVANPSSYAWPTDERPTGPAGVM